jgi:hypothetical protein
MVDPEDHPETLSTQGQYLRKGPIVSHAKDQVEEKCQPNENTVSDISAVEVRFKKQINDGRKIEVVVQGCVVEDYAQVIVVAVGMAQIQPGGTRDETALELCKAMKRARLLAGHSDDNNEVDDNNNNSMGLEASLVTVKHK